MTNERKSGHLGQGMLTVFWLLVLGALSYGFYIWEDRRQNPNQHIQGRVSTDVREVELVRNAYGHYVSSGEINRQRVTFMLDTGASSVAVPEALALKLGLKRGLRHQVYTANGIADAYYTRIAHLRLGVIELNDVAASITPGMTGDEILLGMSALKQLDFSQSGNRLTLIQHQ